MRHLSKKRAISKREADKLRDAFREEFPKCWLCPNPAVDVHEIVRGSSRWLAYGERCAWISVCRVPCHDRLGRYDMWPLERQYAIKAIRDTEHYDRVALNRMRGRADDAISEQDVMFEIVNLIKSGVA